MVKGTPRQQATIERVLHEFKDGTLEGAGGQPVTDRRQAIAIALTEAGESNRRDPKQNRAAAHRTQVLEKKAGATKAALLAEARARGVPGRSRMSKAALVRALA